MAYNKIVKTWLLIGCVMLFFQIIIGGVTRITGSGLSITKWEIVTGTFPPLSEAKWEEEFNKYKETPQYEKINRNMELGSLMDSGSFKFIYFWEYFHRLWARMMGFVFLFPFVFFIYRKWIDKVMIKKLGLVFLGAALAAFFGWIMVASGLKERPWVNAYNLSLHLGIALLTLMFLWHAVFHAFYSNVNGLHNSKLYKLSKYFFVFLCFQIFFGAVVSGMKASLYYPTWPEIGNAYIPSILFDFEIWSIDNILDYDKSPLMPALIHVLHRNLGYFVYGLGLFLVYKVLRYPLRRQFYIVNISLFLFLNLQVFLGIMTLLRSSDVVPVFYGVMHQAIAIFIFSISLYNLYIFSNKQNINGPDST